MTMEAGAKKQTNKQTNKQTTMSECQPVSTRKS